MAKIVITGSLTLSCCLYNINRPSRSHKKYINIGGLAVRENAGRMQNMQDTHIYMLSIHINFLHNSKT